MSSINSTGLDQANRRMLLRLAGDSIRHGLSAGQPLAVEPLAYPEALRKQRASFVTLQREGLLRGCIGHLEAVTALVVDVADNAFAAAFRDPRFPVIMEHELNDLRIKIAILSPPQPMTFRSEQELIGQLSPGADGLILEDNCNRGTFLPSVWEQLPEPSAFLQHLKRKADLPPDYWSDTLKVSRYHTESFGDE